MTKQNVILCTTAQILKKKLGCFSRRILNLRENESRNPLIFPLLELWCSVLILK